MEGLLPVLRPSERRLTAAGPGMGEAGLPSGVGGEVSGAGAGPGGEGAPRGAGLSTRS